MQGSMRAYFAAKAKNVPFYSKACYGLPGTPKWPLEAYIVLVLTGEAYVRLDSDAEDLEAYIGPALIG